WRWPPPRRPRWRTIAIITGITAITIAAITTTAVRTTPRRTTITTAGNWSAYVDRSTIRKRAGPCDRPFFFRPPLRPASLRRQRIRRLDHVGPAADRSARGVQHEAVDPERRRPKRVARREIVRHVVRRRIA